MAEVMGELGASQTLGSPFFWIIGSRFISRLFGFRTGERVITSWSADTCIPAYKSLTFSGRPVKTGNWKMVVQIELVRFVE